jgi:hypothetical protein
MPINRLPMRPLENSNPDRKDLLFGLLLVLLVAVVYYAQWSLYLSEVVDSKVDIYTPQKYFWWADDSRDYRATGDWLFGRSEETFIELRPWLYPLWVGFFRAALGPGAETALWIGQVLMWLASIAFLYLALHNSTKRPVLAILGSALFFSHPSALVLTFHGLTETLNILLLTILLWLLTTGQEKRWMYILLLLSLLTVTKPTYQIQLGLFGLYFIVKNAKLPKLKLAGLVALALVPVWIQLAISLAYNGRVSLSDIGPYTFKNFFVAVVHSHTENLPWRESLAVIEDWGLEEQFGYLTSHPRETVRTYRDNLLDRNLWIGSFFLRGEGNRMAGFAQSFNALALYAHLIMLPLTLYFLLSPRYRGQKELLAIIYSIFLIQTLVTGISTGQEDRLIITGLPLWIFTYLTALPALCVRREAGEA